MTVNTSLRFALAALALAMGASAGAQSSGPLIYPAKDQSAKQQEQDRFECYSWAKAQSGFDPAQAAPMPAGQPTQTAQAAQQKNSTAGGMVVGAAGGAAVAELTHHSAGRGAAVGALGGGLMAKAKEKQAMQAAQQQANQQASQQQAARAQQKSAYDRGFAACLEGRGYVVK